MKPALDKEGFLLNIDDWSPGVAKILAHNEGIELQDDHWAIVDAIRKFYEQTEVSLAMRPLVKLVHSEVDPLLGSSIALMRLFGDSPAKMVAKISGLPKPANCL